MICRCLEGFWLDYIYNNTVQAFAALQSISNSYDYVRA